MWQSAYVQRNSFGHNFESSSCLFHFSGSSKTKLFRNVKVYVNNVCRDTSVKLKLTDGHSGKSVDKKMNTLNLEYTCTFSFSYFN